MDRTTVISRMFLVHDWSVLRVLSELEVYEDKINRHIVNRLNYNFTLNIALLTLVKKMYYVNLYNSLGIYVIF